MVNDTAEGPKVRAGGDSFLGQQLGANVLGGADEAVAALPRVGLVQYGLVLHSVVRFEDLGTPEVGHLDMHVLVEQYVLGLQVPVHDVQVV